MEGDSKVGKSCSYVEIAVESVVRNVFTSSYLLAQNGNNERWKVESEIKIFWFSKMVQDLGIDQLTIV